MKKSALVICPGRGSYQKQQLGMTGHGSNSTTNLLLSIVSNKKPLSKKQPLE